MRTFIWWLRSLFCAHEWRAIGEWKVIPINAPHDTVEVYSVAHVKECKKCGWRWVQRSRP